MTPEPRLVQVAYDALFERLKAATGDVLLVSPFLSFTVCDRIAEMCAQSPGAWRLVTRKDAAAANTGHLNIPGLRRLLSAGVKLEHVTGLHAKVFLVGDEFGLVGSANLTESGLGSSPNPNAELGVQLTSEEVAASRAIITDWQRTPVTAADLDQLEEDARKLARPARSPRPTPKASVATIDRLLADARDGRSLWVKAEYGRRNPQHWTGESYFASPGKTRKPRIKPGDLALIYSQGIHACYAVVEVIDAPRFDPPFLIQEGSSEADAARWPWISRTIPRLVPDAAAAVTAEEIGVSARALQNGHVRVDLAGFAAGVRALQRVSAAESEGD